MADSQDGENIKLIQPNKGKLILAFCIAAVKVLFIFRDAFMVNLGLMALPLKAFAKDHLKQHDIIENDR